MHKKTLLWAKGLLLAIFSYSLLPSAVQAQEPSKVYTKELELTTDNDVYLFNLYDKYYTNGLQLSWRKALPDSSGLLNRLNRHRDRVKKITVGLSLAQKIYSPQIIYVRRLSYMDRPYAGWLSLAGNASFFLSDQTLLRAGLDVGVTGKASGGEWLQKHWHRWFSLPRPLNWEYQIRDQVVSHLNLSWQNQSLDFTGGDLISESSLQAGNLLTNLRQSATIRLGKAGPLSHSTFTNSRLGVSPGGAADKEFYFLAGVGLEYVFKNGLINGRLQENYERQFAAPRPWVFHWRTGVAYACKAMTFSFDIFHLSPEFEGGSGHGYGSIGIAIRY